MWRLSIEPHRRLWRTVACCVAMAALAGCFSYSREEAPPPAYSAAAPYCREVPATAVIDGQPQTVYGRACQQPDGSWRAAR
jgi:hypothetical protein